MSTSSLRNRKRLSACAGSTHTHARGPSLNGEFAEATVSAHWACGENSDFGLGPVSAPSLVAAASGACDGPQATPKTAAEPRGRLPGELRPFGPSRRVKVHGFSQSSDSDGLGQERLSEHPASLFSPLLRGRHLRATALWR